MRHTWTLAKVRMLLALRSRAFIFFSLVMPLAFLFFFEGIFARGNPMAVTYLLAPVLALTVMGSFWGLSVQLVTFREQGVLRRFRLAPVTSGAMLASSIVSNYFLVLPPVVIEFLIARWLFHMGAWGDLGSVFLLVSVGGATFSAFGLIVASVSNTMQETQVIDNIIWTVSLLLSGATIPLMILPGWIQRLSLFLPATYLVAGLQDAMLRTGNLRGLAGDVFSLAAGLVTAFEISRQLFRWEPEAKVPGRAKISVAVAMAPFLLLGIWENVYGQRLQQIQKDYQSIERHIMSEPSH